MGGGCWVGDINLREQDAWEVDGGYGDIHLREQDEEELNSGYGGTWLSKMRRCIVGRVARG
jgi:hypothetical protein